MAGFYKGFVYEALSAGLTVEGISIQIEAASTDAKTRDELAWQYIDDVLVPDHLRFSTAGTKGPHRNTAVARRPQSLRVVEMTNLRSTPLEVQAIAPNYGVPILPIVRGKATVPAMVSGLRKSMGARSDQI